MTNCVFRPADVATSLEYYVWRNLRHLLEGVKLFNIFKLDDREEGKNMTTFPLLYHDAHLEDLGEDKKHMAKDSGSC